MMRKTSFAIAVLLVCAVTPAKAAMGGGVHRLGPPESVNPTMQYVCRPRDGGNTCTTVPYGHLGAACSCEGPRGPRPGKITPR